MTSEKYTLMEQQADQHNFLTNEDVYCLVHVAIMLDRTKPN